MFYYNYAAVLIIMLVNTGIIIGENNNKNYRMEYCGLRNFCLYARVLIIIMLQASTTSCMKHMYNTTHSTHINTIKLCED